MIAFMKLLSGIICEFIHILIISAQDETADIIKDFVAIGFIVEIDNLFAKYYSRKEKLDFCIQDMKHNLMIERASGIQR